MIKSFWEEYETETHQDEYYKSEECKESSVAAHLKSEIAWKKHRESYESRMQAAESYKLSMTRGTALLHFVNGNITKEEYNNFLKSKK